MSQRGLPSRLLCRVRRAPAAALASRFPSRNLSAALPDRPAYPCTPSATDSTSPGSRPIAVRPDLGPETRQRARLRDVPAIQVRAVAVHVDRQGESLDTPLLSNCSQPDGCRRRPARSSMAPSPHVRRRCHGWRPAIREPVRSADGSGALSRRVSGPAARRLGPRYGRPAGGGGQPPRSATSTNAVISCWAKRAAATGRVRPFI